MNFLEQFPDRQTLLDSHTENGPGRVYKVNNHIHTPYSFSAFSDVDEAVRLAVSENVRILGINDFYVTDGYEEFLEICLRQRLFPLLNVELIGISKQDQEKGIRVNDPNNPGRTYISGKGLAYPSILPESGRAKLQMVVEESNRQVAEMIGLLNGWLREQDVDIELSVEEIMERLAVNLLRERHVAKMLRLKLEAHAESDPDFYEILRKIYHGRPPQKERSDIAGTEDELRARLLKSGSPAFVPEDEKAFLPTEEIEQIIREAGGIPTYPLLLDGAGGEITEFEIGKEHLLEVLGKRGYHSVEYIPLRNRFEKLKEYAEYFYNNGFVVSFGTEHNTSAMRPLTVSCKDDVPLDDSLMEISYRGAAYLAAHQYRQTREGADYEKWTRDEMEKLGDSILSYYFHTFNP